MAGMLGAIQSLSLHEICSLLLVGVSMDKREAAASFFEKLGQSSGNFISDMIESKMDASLIELFNQLGGQLKIGEMDTNRYQASLLIIGYLVRAYEEDFDGRAQKPEPEPPEETPPPDQDDNGTVH